MKVMWAPWRAEYVLSDNKKNGCIFCPAENQKSAEERLILRIDPYSLVMMNRYPYNNGHLLIAPLKHASDLESLSDGELMELMHNVHESISILKRVMKPEGFNVGLNIGRVAGAGVEDHLHFHVVPRWTGDTNMMTVLGDVRVIPEHIKQTYLALLKHFENSRK
jgi:ATP adenylyltransferase